MTTLTTEQTAALDIARALVAAGIPLFLATPRVHPKMPWSLPDAWEQTPVNPGVVDRWRPGMALCAVMGHGLDLLDVDPRNGGEVVSLNGSTPIAYAVAATPSGGMHSFIASLGVGSRDNTYPGIDVKGGYPDGTGRGFAFIAPTVAISKVTGAPVAYQWLIPPDLDRLAAGGDTSGAAVAARIRSLKAESGSPSAVADGVPDWYRTFASQKEPHSELAAQQAITAKLTEVVSWKRENGIGFRHTLERAAMTLGGYVGGGYLPVETARTALEEACAAVWGAADSDDQLWISQGLTDGATPERRFSVYTLADELAAQAGEAPTAWNIYSATGLDIFTPVGNDQELAQAVSMRIRPILRYAGSSWVVRRQFCWHEKMDMADWAVSTLARLMPLGDPSADKDTEACRLAGRRAKFMGSGSAGIEKKLRSISRHPDDPLSIELEDLDTDPEILWAGGLPWDLRASAEEPALATGVDLDTPHLRTALYTPVTQDTPLWDAFLAVVWPDPAVRAWALRVLSIGLTGYPDEALPVLWGTERTGKSSVASLLVQVLGGYAHAADPRLLAGVDNVHASVVYALKGRRLSFIDEGPRAGHLALERLKQLTGGAELTGNAMRANPVTFSPTHTLVMTSNNEPVITDPALAARMRIIPCHGDLRAVRSTRMALAGGWMTEAPGILAAMMREAAAWLADRDSARNEVAPESVRTTVAEMIRNQDPVGDWVSLCTIPATPGDQASTLYRHFCEWFDASAVHRRTTRPSQTAFGLRLTKLGYPSVKIGRDADRLVYRPLTILQGYTGPYVPPPSSANAERMPVVVETVRNDSATCGPPDSADAEQARSTNQNHDQTTNCANANTADAHESDNQDETGSSESEATGRVGGESGESRSTELSPPETPRSAEVFLFSGDSGDSSSSLPTNQPKIQDHIHPLEEVYSSPLENVGRPSPTVPDDLGNPPTSVPPTTGDAVGTVGENEPSPAPSVGPAVPAPAKSINSDLEPNPASDITARLLTSAKAAGTRMGKITELDQHQGENSNTSADQGKRRKPAATPRVKLTPEQREANKIAKAVAVAEAKATARAAAVAAAAGETVPLPAAVLRGTPPRSVTIAEAGEIVRRATARDTGKLNVDIETNGYPIGHPLHMVRTVQLGDLIECVVFDATDSVHTAAAGELIAAAPRLGAFSATADLAPLAHLGVIDHEAAWAKMQDAVIAAKLADPAGAGSDAAEGLKKLSALTLGPAAVSASAEAARDELGKAAGWTFAPKPGETAHERNGWAMVASDCATMVTYAACDVLDTAALAHRLPDPGEALNVRERALQRLVARVTYTGVAIDGDLSRRLLDVHQGASTTATTAVRSFGIDNPASSQQVAAKLTAMGLVLPRTKPSKTYPNGQLSADKEALMGLRAEGLDGDAAELVAQLLEFGSHKNAISTFLKPYVYLCEEGDGRARPTVYTMEAKTGRMSCVRPNFQNIPREGGFRSQIIADPGFLQIGADFSGVELRVAAALSQDQHLISIIAADDAAKRLDPKARTDIHWKIAFAAYGPNATKAQRYNVKRAVFGRLYGSGVEGIKNTLGITMAEAQQIVNILDGMTPALSAWSRNLANSVRAGNTHFPTHSGRIIHLRSPHSAPNYAIQGTAREIIIDALIKWADTQWGRCVLWPVHDEIDVMVSAHEAIDATSALVECMETSFRGVPIIAEAAAPSACWQDAA